MLASQLLDHWPVADWQHRKVLVAVSGGADSVALLCALSEVVDPHRLVAAHYNHAWRGEASDADEAFVVHLCHRLRIECLLGRHAHSQLPAPSDAAPSMHQPDQNDSGPGVNSAMHAKEILLDSESGPLVLQSEELARTARYQFLIRSAYESGASYVATAHTADDRVETLLHNLFRGSGLAGAASLRMFRELDKDLILVRPLIAKSKKELLQFLSERNQNYCTDASNTNEKYARNYIRGQILPSVRLRYPDVDANLGNFSELVEEALSDIRLLARRWLLAMESDWRAGPSATAGASSATLAAWREQAYWVASASAAREQPWTVVREALRLVWLERGWPLGDMSRRHWESLRAHIYKPAPAMLAELPPSLRQTLAVLPGEVFVEAAEGFLAIGRRASVRP